MSETTSKGFEGWAVVELFGHHQIAGYVSEAQIGGASFVRVDVPEAGPERPAHTKFFGPAAIYALHPCAEELARQAVKQLRRWDNPLPVVVPDLQAARQTIEEAARARTELRRLNPGAAVSVPDDDDEPNLPF